MDHEQDEHWESDHFCFFLKPTYSAHVQLCNFILEIYWSNFAWLKYQNNSYLFLYSLSYNLI